MGRKTLGDFWGITESEINPDLELGTSVVLINSARGKKLFENIFEDGSINRYQKTFNDVLKGNPALLENPPIGKNREEFFSHIDKIRFDKLVDKYKEKLPLQKILSKNIKSIIKSLIKGF